ncbi:MAG TPA: hypothetical protein PKA05_07985 [Roseiflexaceae bacterium]|nr:hypothetical protein [Roseiflexaceae bacterium]HMP40303.1 hypothetical protein [Roseiflexaceae bacterium]
MWRYSARTIAGIRHLLPLALLAWMLAEGRIAAAAIADHEPATGTGQPVPGGWIDRSVAVGNWVLDAGLGIAGGALGTINDVLLAAWRMFGSTLDRSGCGGVFQLVLCTPPELFLSREGTLGPLIRRVWDVLTPVSTSLIVLLFVVRIGRVVADGSAGLATEARPLIMSFVAALSFIHGMEQILGMTLAGLNEFHRVILSSANATLLDTIFQPLPDLNFGAQFAMLVMLLTALVLAIKALGRMVHLTMLIGIAPLMGALLLDRSTSTRFGAWLARLIDVLLQQTVWVFFFWFGTLFFSAALRLDSADMMGRIGMYAAAAAVFGLAITGESALSGIAGAGGSAGMARTLVQNRLVREGVRGMQHTIHAAGNLGRQSATLVATRMVSGDPTQSAAQRRIDRHSAMSPIPQAALLPPAAPPPPPPPGR